MPYEVYIREVSPLHANIKRFVADESQFVEVRGFYVLDHEIALGFGSCKWVVDLVLVIHTGPAGISHLFFFDSFFHSAC